MTLDATFTAPIRKDGAFATYLELDGSAEVLGTRKAVKVTGTLDGHEFAATLMPSGCAVTRLLDGCSRAWTTTRPTRRHAWRSWSCWHRGRRPWMLPASASWVSAGRTCRWFWRA